MTLQDPKGRKAVVSTLSADPTGIPPSAILLVSARTEDHDSLQSIFRGSQWALQQAWTVSDGRQTIRRDYREIPVVICERSLPDGDWKLLLEELEKVAVRPSLIVCSRLADERLWAEVLHLGAFDLLQGAPFEPEEVLRVTHSAWSAWNRADRPIVLQRIGPGSERKAPDSVAKVRAAGSQIGFSD
jgi:DNA-binding NtrC family response regulator